MVILVWIYVTILEALYFLLSPILFAVFWLKPYSGRLAVNYPDESFDIIVHAASVGEINGIKQLLLELLSSGRKILLTTNTITGLAAASNIDPSIRAILSPLDVLHLRLKQISLSNPKLLIIAETEIWPMLLLACRLRRIKVMYVNARMSDRTFSTYYQYRSLLKWLGYPVCSICVQTQKDKEKYEAIFGIDAQLSGNLKYCVKHPLYDKDFLREKWGYQTTDIIIAIGSSRPGEEKLLLESYQVLQNTFSQVKLIIVPRHLNRLDEIRSLLQNNDYSMSSQKQQSKDIHVINEMGRLNEVYAICDISIIGGSFYPFGGHNPLEAAYYAKPIIMGPYHSSCLDSVIALKKAKAIIISNHENLTKDLSELLKNKDEIKRMGESSQKVFAENSKILQIHLDEVGRCLS